ncbi:MAG: hypothetical protein ACI81R_002905 [Bradymonadia bacterium]|jgi:hypothetical protein
MSEDDKADNVIRVDFRQGQVLADDEEHEPVSEPGVIDEDEPKHVTFARLVEAGLVMVKLDARARDVSVPDQFEGVPQLHLNFSHRFNIDDFTWDEDSVRASLSFDTGDFYCVVPWSAIYVMECEAVDAIHIFPDSFPEELQAVLPKILEGLKHRDPDT